MWKANKERECNHVRESLGNEELLKDLSPETMCSWAWPLIQKLEDWKEHLDIFHDLDCLGTKEMTYWQCTAAFNKYATKQLRMVSFHHLCHQHDVLIIL